MQTSRNCRPRFLSALTLAVTLALSAAPATAHRHHDQQDDHGQPPDHAAHDGGHDAGHDIGHGEYGAHLHGLAELNLIIEGSDLEIELTSPAMNKVGFEYQPRNREQQEAVTAALATLRDGNAIFALPPAAACRQLKAEVGTDLEGPATAADHDGGHGHDHSHDHNQSHEKQQHDHEGQHDHDDGHDKPRHGHESDHGSHYDHVYTTGHADFTAHWHFRCDQPQQLKRIEVLLFQAFPATHRIQVQAITPQGQLGAELTPASRYLDMP